MKFATGQELTTLPRRMAISITLPKLSLYEAFAIRAGMHSPSGSHWGILLIIIQWGELVFMV